MEFLFLTFENNILVIIPFQLNWYIGTQTLAFIDCLNYLVGSGIDVLLRDVNIYALNEVA